MKLQARYNYVNLITTVAVLLITGLIYYQAISWILTWQKDNDLRDEEQEAFEYVSLNHRLPQTFDTHDQQITFTEAPSNSVTRRFIDTAYTRRPDPNDFHQHHHGHHHGQHGDTEPGRGLISSVTVGDKYYRLLIIESTVETEDIVRVIFTITIGIILLLAGVLLLVNRLVLGRLWRPFYSIMAGLRSFDIAGSDGISAIDTTTDEFVELDGAVRGMTEKARHDYRELKTFTENASHELLTPIAVINSKLDTLIQAGEFNEKQSSVLNDLYTAVSRLSRLNQSLLLLSKIENKLLHEEQAIDLKALLEENLAQFEEIFSDKHLEVTAALDEKQVNGSRYLAEILVSNLLTNAIRHNIDGGHIGIVLTTHQLLVRNSGIETPLDSAKIFTRFQKSPGSEGSGLGLTISQQICAGFGFSFRYVFEEGFHTFIVGFSGEGR
jgi:signal transduction histidine kinase